MPTVRQPSDASQREVLAVPRPTQAKADLRTQACASRLRDVAADTIRTVSGNARAAAIDLDIHEGHLSRLLRDGSIRLEQLETLGPAFAATFGARLVEQFGPLASPKDRARRLCDDMQGILNELRQFVENAA